MRQTHSKINPMVETYFVQQKIESPSMIAGPSWGGGVYIKIQYQKGDIYQLIDQMIKGDQDRNRQKKNNKQGLYMSFCVPYSICPYITYSEKIGEKGGYSSSPKWV